MLTWARGHLGLLIGAVVVLAVAMTSSATAALVITGKDVKNESLTGKDVKDGSLKADDLSRAAQDALEGAPGAAGAPGATFLGSPCAVPGGGSGTFVAQVAANGTVSMICSVPAAPAQNGDFDADGYLRSQECHDGKPGVHPGATELAANRIDDDCDGTADNGTSDSGDADSDGVSLVAGDCDDTDSTTFPSNTDTFGNGIDNDCDGVDG